MSPAPSSATPSLLDLARAFDRTPEDDLALRIELAEKLRPLLGQDFDHFEACWDIVDRAHRLGQVRQPPSVESLLREMHLVSARPGPHG